MDPRKVSPKGLVRAKSGLGPRPWAKAGLEQPSQLTLDSGFQDNYAGSEIDCTLPECFNQVFRVEIHWLEDGILLNISLYLGSP